MLSAYENEGWVNETLPSDSCIYKIIELIMTEYGGGDNLEDELDTELHQQRMVSLQNRVNSWNVQEILCRELSKTIKSEILQLST